MKTTEWIIPATDLQTDLAAVLQKAQQHPLIILDENRPKVYVVSVDAFDALMERVTALEEAELATNIAIAKQQFDRGEFVSLPAAITLLETKWEQRSD